MPEEKTLQKNPYVECIKRNIMNSQVRVRDHFGDWHEGVCVGLNYMHLNIVLTNDDGLVVIKNPQVILLKKEVKK